MHLAEIDPELQRFDNLRIGQIGFRALFIEELATVLRDQRAEQPLRGADIAGNAHTPSGHLPRGVLANDRLAIADHFVPRRRIFLRIEAALRECLLVPVQHRGGALKRR